MIWFDCNRPDVSKMKFIAILFFLYRQKILKAILVEKYDKTNEIHFKCTLETSECFYHVRIFKLILSTLLFIMICNNIYLFCSLSSVDATKFPAAKCFLFHKRARNYKISIDFYENKDLLWSFNSLGTSTSTSTLTHIHRACSGCYTVFEK